MQIPESHKPPVVLTIAGFDPSSGAGITADLQVFAAHGLFGTSCITALTVQSTQGVAATESVARVMGATLAHLEADLPPVGIKIGMLGNAHAVRATADYLRGRQGHAAVIVLDPVLVSSSGHPLLDADGLQAMRTELLPLVGWITPNVAELEILSGQRGSSPAEIEAAMRKMWLEYPNLSIVVTGGHLETPAETLLTPLGELLRFDGEWIETTSTHGTGCAFSSALLANLVLGIEQAGAVVASKTYVTQALRSAPGLGKGHGPLDLLWPLRPGDRPS